MDKTFGGIRNVDENGPKLTGFGICDVLAGSGFGQKSQRDAGFQILVDSPRILFIYSLFIVGLQIIAIPPIIRSILVNTNFHT